MTDRPPPPPMMEPPEPRGLPAWFWALGLMGVMALFFGLMLAVPAIYGVKKYVQNAKLAEARGELGRFASGLSACATAAGPDGAPRGLPDTSPPVPAELASVSGKKYQSTPTDWRADAFTCAGFSMSGPQYFVYQWRKIDPSRGVATAIADLDGDGTADHTFEQAVSCLTPEMCRAEVMDEPDELDRALEHDD